LTTEKYLTCIQEKKFRIALTRFRISAHDLRIETGRYTNTDRQNRICSYCHMNTVENEYHFLLTCPKYRDIRKRFLPNSIYTWPNINKFTSIMSSSSNKIINNISKFIYYANKTRSWVHQEIIPFTPKTYKRTRDTYNHIKSYVYTCTWIHSNI
jgi:hypothetical protein